MACARNAGSANRTLRLVMCVFVFFGAEVALAQTRVFVENNSSYTVKISKSLVTGAKLNRKAWKQGVLSIQPGERKSVLRMNRSGKLNWMDPTPRFIEPGKTVVFSTTLSIDELPSASSLALKQKLFGEGATSKLWYSLKSGDNELQWMLDGAAQVMWKLSETNIVNISFRAYTEGKNTHIEYVLSSS